LQKYEDFSVPKHVLPYFSIYLLQDIHIIAENFSGFLGGNFRGFFYLKSGVIRGIFSV
jgi:hypothetical protein